MIRVRRRAFTAGAVASLLVGGSYIATRAQNGQTMPAAGNGGSPIRDKRPVVHPNAVKFGAYDPHGDFASQETVSTEGLFLPWEDVDLSSLGAADAYALERKRDLLITVEPWSWDAGWRLTSDELRRKVLAGDYDANMRAIAKLIGGMKSKAILRWGQEMEDTSGRFSWSGWAPRDYITAYRRMMAISREEAPNVGRMWSPKGLANLAEYYPGDGEVDLVGLSVFGLEAYDKIAHGGPQSFADKLKPGYDRVQNYGKPVWVAELGYEGGNAYLQPWMDDVTKRYAEFPRLEEVVYFNDREVHPWPYNLGRPDWRVVRNEAV